MVRSARNPLLREVSVVAERREPQRWLTELTKNVPCQSATVETKKPQTSIGRPPMRKRATASKTGGTRWYVFSQRSSGYLLKSLISRVSAEPSRKIHSTWLSQKPCLGECGSPDRSE